MSRGYMGAATALALCNYNLARRGEPLRPLVHMTRDEQRRFWTRKPLLTTYREGRKARR